jgi:tetratricopeptide (TPR) repeat protein
LAKAKVNYFQGRLYRQRGKEHDFEKATAKFYESSENYFKCVKKNSTEADVIYSRTRASVCLGFGIGFLNYTRSFLQRAKNVITPARLSFYKNDGKPCCQIHFYYLNLLYASVLRAEAGQASTEEKRAKLFEAQDILEVCEQVFYRKPKYLVHAHYNLALLFYSLGKEKYGKALEHIDKIIDLSQGNPKWEANALIVKSRIYRQEGHHDEALQAASKACRQSVDYRAIYCEALLARGQAHLERKNFSAAQDDFNDVIDRNNNENQKVEAVALIYLTRTALNQNKRDDALELFGRVRGMMNTIEHGFVIDEFEKLKEELKVGPAPFFVSYREEDLTWDKHEKNLKKWLLQRALSTDKNVANAAKQLGVSNKTVYQWIKEFKESKSADT